MMNRPALRNLLHRRPGKWGSADDDNTAVRHNMLAAIPDRVVAGPISRWDVNTFFDDGAVQLDTFADSDSRHENRIGDKYAFTQLDVP
jgi:hypothetical protein